MQALRQLLTDLRQPSRTGAQTLPPGLALLPQAEFRAAAGRNRPSCLAPAGLLAAAVGVSAWAFTPRAFAQPAASVQVRSAAPPPAVPQALERLLVRRVESQAAPPQLTRALEELLLAELGQRQGLSVLSPAELEQSLRYAKDKEELGCQELDSCLRAAERHLRASRMLTPKLDKLGDEWMLTLAIADVRAQVVGRRVAGRAHDFGQLQALVPQLVESLMGEAPVQRFRLPPGEALEVAVMPLSAEGVEPATASAMTQILAAEYSQVHGLSVLGRDDIQAMLEQVASAGELGCLDDLKCVAELGAAFGVSRLVVGSVGQVGKTHVVALRLLNTREARVDSRVVEVYEGEASELRHALKVAAHRLLGLDLSQPSSSLELSFNAPGGHALLGRQRYRFDQHRLRLTRLRPGRYPLWVQPEGGGYLPLRTELYVAPGSESMRDLALREAPPRWYQKWWVWAIAGAVVASSAVAVGLSRGEPERGVEVNVAAAQPGP